VFLSALPGNYTDMLSFRHQFKPEIERINFTTSGKLPKPKAHRLFNNPTELLRYLEAFIRREQDRVDPIVTKGETEAIVKETIGQLIVIIMGNLRIKGRSIP
jgi:hypothetical protein